MAEVRFQMDDNFLKELQKALGTSKATDVVREALTVLNWAVKEKGNGKVILSGDPETNDLVRLATPGLDKVMKNVPKAS